MSRRTLFVAGFSSGTRAKDLAYEFERYGRLVRCDIPAPRSSSSKPYAFVEFEDSRDADDAYRDMHGRSVDGYKISIQWAKNPPRDSRDSRDRRDRSRSPRRERRGSRSPRRGGGGGGGRDRSRDRDRRRSRSPPKRRNSRSPRRSSEPEKKHESPRGRSPTPRVDMDVVENGNGNGSPGRSEGRD